MYHYILFLQDGYFIYLLLEYLNSPFKEYFTLLKARAQRHLENHYPSNFSTGVIGQHFLHNNYKIPVGYNTQISGLVEALLTQFCFTLGRYPGYAYSLSGGQQSNQLPASNLTNRLTEHGLTRRAETGKFKKRHTCLLRPMLTNSMILHSSQQKKVSHVAKAIVKEQRSTLCPQ